MTASETLTFRRLNRRLLFLISAAVLTFFLFFIDEGYYDLRWMKSFGNWVVFVLYVSILFGLQFLTDLLLRKTGLVRSSTWPVVGVAFLLVVLFLLFLIFT